MSRRAARILLSALLLAMPVAGLAAPVQQIAGDSTLHRVEAALVSKVGVPTVYVLRHTTIGSDGARHVGLVPGTEDLFVDREPALAIDPVSGQPVLAWSRDTGSGFDIYVARYDGTAWSWPVLGLGAASADEVRPQIQVSQSLVHVVAHDGARYQRISLDRATLEPVYGPETLPTSGIPITPGLDAGTTPPETHVYFASDVLRPSPTDPGLIVIWGVRDEPVPIDYVQVMLVPVDLEQGALGVVSPIEGSLTVTVTSPSRIWYTLFQQTSWSEFSGMDLDESMTVSDVRAMLADMIRRAD